MIVLVDTSVFSLAVLPLKLHAPRAARRAVIRG